MGRIVQNHVRAFFSLDHILPSDPAIAEGEASVTEDKALWTRIDAIVLQWIYGMISNDLLHTIIEPNSTTQQAWERLRDIFQDNKNSRAVHLEHQFSNLAMDDFPNARAYCQKLKMIADQLANVGAPVSNHGLVLRLIAGLPTLYRSLVTQIHNKDPFPLFSTACSMLRLEDSTLSDIAALEAQAAMVVIDEPVGEPNHNQPNGNDGRNNQNNNRGRRSGGRGHEGTGGRGRGGGGRGSCQNQPHNAGWFPATATTVTAPSLLWSMDVALGHSPLPLSIF